jgi:chaperonin GroEL
VTDHTKDDCVFEDTYILVSDSEINNLLTIENVLKPIINDGKKLLIIAPCSQNVVNTLAANVMKNGLKICAVQPPNFGYKQHELMQDIALTVGATYFSEKTGDDLSIMTAADLGHAQKVIVERDSTIIVRDKDGKNAEAIAERVEQLWAAHRMSKKKADKEFILSRIASLSGGVGVIYVGGNTDLEQKELYDRVDDAVCAVRSALEEGILPGGGVALFKEAIKILSKNASEQSIAEKILAEALAAPMNQILENAGIKEFLMADTEYSYGLDVKNNKFGDMYELGVIDPLKVTKSALQNAVSVAVTILSTNAIITMARTYQSE